MKSLLRIFIFSYIALFATQNIIGGFSYGFEPNITIFLLLIALTLVNYFASPLFRLLGLPSGGIGYLFLSFVLNLALLYVLTILVPFFNSRATVLPELIIFGFVLPSKSLTSAYSLIFSTLLLSVLINFLTWLSTGKKK